MKNAHTHLVNQIIRRLGTSPHCRIWKAHVGGVGRLRFGVPGQADITGILSGGRRLEIEVKTGTGRLSKDQERFKTIIEKYDGVHIVARSVGQLLLELKRRGYVV